jgi:hypothetical protein
MVVDSAMAQAADLESVRGDFNNEDINNRNNSYPEFLEINNSAMSFDDVISEAADPESVQEFSALNLKDSSQNNIANKSFSLSVNKYHFLPGE